MLRPIPRRRPRPRLLGGGLLLSEGGTRDTTLAGTPAPAPAPAPPSGAAGPCDIYGGAGTPCVAAHSTVRALYAAYRGPLYQSRHLQRRGNR
eukprot:gene17944-biopygen6047